MAIGRTFKESFQKALRSLEIGAPGFVGPKSAGLDEPILDQQKIREGIAIPTSERVFWLRHAFLSGMTPEAIHEICAIDPWFLQQLSELVDIENALRATSLTKLGAPLLRQAKYGFSDALIAQLINASRQWYAKNAKRWISTQYRLVDTCAAEFQPTSVFLFLYGAETKSPH